MVKWDDFISQALRVCCVTDHVPFLCLRCKTNSVYWIMRNFDLISPESTKLPMLHKSLSHGVCIHPSNQSFCLYVCHWIPEGMKNAQSSCHYTFFPLILGKSPTCFRPFMQCSTESLFMRSYKQTISSIIPNNIIIIHAYHKYHAIISFPNSSVYIYNRLTILLLLLLLLATL
jgi:hypothetical protein